MAKKPKVYSIDSGRSKTRKGVGAPDTEQPEFDTVESIRKTVENMQLIENERARDRALVDVLANGERPYSPQEVDEYQIKYNVNWGELKNSVRQATAQVNAALLFKPTLFTATSLGGPVEKRDVYSQKFTAKINKKLKKGKIGRQFKFLMKSRNSSVTLHGPGVMYWPNSYCPLSQFVPLENFLVPTDTLLDFSNCSYFDIKVELTPFELYEKTHGTDKADENWNMEQVDAILEGLEEMGTLNTNNYNWVQHPEKMQEIFKQNRCYLNSDAVAKVKLDYFFSKENDGNWFLKIVMREGVGEADPDEFVYTSEQPFADDLDKILHIQFGDNNIVPPHKYHSTRGIGTDNYAPAWSLNDFRCSLFQHAKEQTQMWLRIQDPADKGRENMVNMGQYMILENGISVVPQDERHQINSDLVDNVIAQCRQNVAENSSQYVQDIDTGTEKEQTLGEAQIRQQTANQNVSTLLTMMYEQECSFYVETVRRWLSPNSGDADIEKFQKECVADGIPQELLVPSNWEVEPDKVLGAGDQSLALQQASALYAARAGFDPDTQRLISRQFVSTLTQDPAKGMLYVPDSPDNSNDGVKAANDLFGTLMQGVEVDLRQGIEQTSYITTMLTNAGTVVKQIQSTDNMGQAWQVSGLAMVLDDIKAHISILAADPTQKQFVKQSMDAVNQLENELKGFANRIQQQKQAANANVKDFVNINFSDLNPDSQNALLQSIGLPPSTMQSPNPKMDAAAQKLQINQAKFQQQTQQKQISFLIDQINKLTAHDAKLTMEQRSHNQDLAHSASEHLMSLITSANESAQAIQQSQDQADAQPAPSPANN